MASDTGNGGLELQKNFQTKYILGLKHVDPIGYLV